MSFKLAVLTTVLPSTNKLKGYRRKKIVRTNHRRFPFPICSHTIYPMGILPICPVDKSGGHVSMNWCKYTDFLLFFKIVGIDQFICWFAQLLKKNVYLNSNQSLAHQRASFFGSVRWSKVVFRCLFCWSYLKNLYIGFGINTMTFFNLKKQQAV